jgi:hypothetical protein
MNADAIDPFRDAVQWLGRCTSFPMVRLSPKAEALVCVSFLAAAEESREQQRFLIQRRDAAQTSAMRAHGMRRSQVHFKCDNSAKV